MDNIKDIIKKVWTKEVILYVIFGVLTTVINLGAFYILNDIFHAKILHKK